MKPLSLYSETFRPEGGAAGQGIRGALGRPKLDFISLMIREAVQNSWDARIPQGIDTRVQFSADLNKFSAPEASLLAKTVFADLPGKHPLASHLKSHLGRLILQDRGTYGLTGPAFVEGPPRPDHRFLNFCRMFGRASEGPLGGGTFGYGKGQFYLASLAATIVVHTRSSERHGFNERLIGMSLWNASVDSLVTGRHWWGTKGANGSVGPVEGEDAAHLASLLGFGAFESDETGTSIMILAPRFDHLGLAWDVAATCIAESMAIWFWPRMLGGCDDLGAISFKVAYKGRAVPVPDPSKHAPFRLYADALRNLRKKAQLDQDPAALGRVYEVWCERPKARLGWLSLALGARQPRERFEVSRIEEHPIADQLPNENESAVGSHHVALMRGPGQVIRYVACRAYPEESMEYAGIFLADGESAEVNEAFARSEPPSHDDWTTDELADSSQKRYLRAALRFIRSTTEEFADSGRPELGLEKQDPLGAISSELGELISAPSTGATREQRERGRRGGGGVPSRLTVDGTGSLQSLDGSIVLVVPFTIKPNSSGFPNVAANPRVIVAGGTAETESPRGGDRPTLVGWRNSNGEIIKEPVLRANLDQGSKWEVIVKVPDDVMVGVSLAIV